MLVFVWTRIVSEGIQTNTQTDRQTDSSPILCWYLYGQESSLKEYKQTRRQTDRQTDKDKTS